MDILHKRLSKDMLCDLELIKQQVIKIHKDRVLIDFTDHGIKHSERMIELLILLCKDNVFRNRKTKGNINDIEIFVLLSAIYMHDIGMQISEEKVLEDFAKEKGLSYKKEKKEEFIRKYHHLLSGYWIECNLKRNKKLPQVYFGEKELGKYIQLIVESHGIDFLEDDRYHQEYSYKGKSIRLRILSILLSLGDSLDCDCRRIDFDKMKYTEIDFYSQLHWLKHYYVNSIMIENSIVKVFYSFPKLKEHEKQLYKMYFSHLNTYWMKHNKEKFLDCLSVFDFVFEIQEFYEENELKEKVSEKGYLEIEEELVDQIDHNRYIEDDMSVIVPNFRIAIGILKKDAQVLLVKRREQEGNLLWQFPAGIIKPKETAEEKMVREFQEETGVTVKVERLLGKRIHPDTKAICYYFVLKYIEGEAINGDERENMEVKWVSVDAYKGLVTSDLYSKIETYLSSNA
ncbi:MAG: NUDIX hydrolase [Hespellia sp.]|nr:NUDIX hydrolase [Hespellia sp.]